MGEAMRLRNTVRSRPFAALLALAAGCAGSDPIGGGGGGMGGGGSGGATGTGGTGGVTPDPEVPTFTWLYDNIFHGYCSDRNQPCHNPGMNRGVDFSTRDRGFNSIQFVLVPGDVFASDLYYLISDGMMPPINPKVPADLQAALAAWIYAGARND
jgi:hypothetical protein